MSLTIELSPEEEQRLAEAVRQEGMVPEEFVRRVLRRNLPGQPGTGGEDPNLALFREWAAEDAQRTPEEIAQENELWEKFETNANETRSALGMRQL